ncbi:Laccase [Metarhizium anisopliae BRIP 53293]|uniref:Laccase 1 n=1 Tax=Metarhizium anisopliae BRIP 53293 TaxID=1291518 RepID=A0A0D9PDQ7_METAN|nr:Laccase [Metarhizium anisopliae BRIP 53293]KJK93549.1 Laccase [Metarhizium anisopliae BRIP 53284]
MALIERVWEMVTSFVTIVSLSILPWSGHTPQPQVPLSPVTPVNQALDYPSFTPPGSSKDSTLQCAYPNMKGWEACSSPLDRSCWLRRKSDGKRLDINTNYEDAWPTGVERHYKINLVDSWTAADGLNFSLAKLFDNQYPGPWIEACWGDRLIVNVTNSLKQNGTSVHWHGMRQLNTTQMDGVNGVTQCPTAPADYFVYNFTLTQYGSSWYHSHYSVQYADGAVGPLTVHGPSSTSWDEPVSPPLILTDWYHNSAYEVVSGGSDGGQDILLNGRGNITKYSCGQTKNSTVILPARSIVFEPPRAGQGCKKYLLRVINTSFDTTFVVSIDNHLLQVISADFVPIQPYTTTSILVGIGQRYDVVVEANPRDTSSPLDKNGNYWIRTEIANCFGRKVPACSDYSEVAILRYNKSSTVDPSTKKWPDIPLRCSDEPYDKLVPIVPWTVKAPSNGPLNEVVPRYGEEFDVYFDPDLIGTDSPVAGFTMDNAVKPASIRINYSDPTFFHLNPQDTKTWPKLWRVQPENYANSEWIYLVWYSLQNRTTGAHPIHLHGHDFAILEQAENKTWNPKNMSLKLDNPPRRDVVLLDTTGYVVIAFRADNPGPWLVHCHIAFHISRGLGMQIMEDQKGAFAMWPDKSPAIVEAKRVCRNWDKWYGNMSNWADKPTSAGGNCVEKSADWCFQNDAGV